MIEAIHSEEDIEKNIIVENILIRAVLIVQFKQETPFNLTVYRKLSQKFVLEVAYLYTLFKYAFSNSILVLQHVGSQANPSH